MGRVLILGTSPSQDFLLTMLLPSWFISPRGLLLLESRNVAGDVRDAGSIPGSERSPGEENSNALQYSCLENPMDRGA